MLGWDGLHIFSERYDQESSLLCLLLTLLTHLLSFASLFVNVWEEVNCAKTNKCDIKWYQCDIKSGKRHYSLFLVTHSTPRNHCNCNNCSRFWSEANNGKLKNVAIHRCTFLILSCLLRALSIVQTAYNTFGIIQLSSCVSCVLCPREKIHPLMKDNFVQCTACKCKCKCKWEGDEKSRLARLHLFQCVPM